MLRDEAYVPFDIDFSEGDGTAKVITGPNMAGKLSTRSTWEQRSLTLVSQVKALVSELP